MMKAHICRANIATSRFFDRGVMTAMPSGPAAQAATVSGAGTRSRFRSSGTTKAAPIAEAAPARTASRSALDGRERLLIRSASIGSGRAAGRRAAPRDYNGRALAPHSPGTDQIDTLLWIGFVAAAIVVVAVNVALFYAVRRFRARRGAEPRPAGAPRGLQFRVGAALTVFAAAIFIAGVVLTGKARDTPSTGSAGLASAKTEPLTIEATGQQWLWRYDYPNGAFSYYKLVVPVDTAVRLELNSTDVVHTWNVPDLLGKRDAVPGKTHTVVFLANDEGVFDGESATLSGQGYASMRTAVEVVSADEYQQFVEQQKSQIEAAQERVVGLIENGEVP
jgi:cytochrome c oxidase subunit 2